MKTIVFVLSLALAGLGFAADPPAKQPTTEATARAEKLKSRVKEFQLSLNFLGDQDKPYYRLTLSVPKLDAASVKPSFLSAQISEPQAARLIDRLAVEGFLDNAQDQTASLATQHLTKPGYTLMVKTDRGILEGDLGWGLPMLKRLDGLREVLDGDAAKQMDLLLGRLAGHRKEWTEQR
jgi:hypothetical protein